MQERIINCVFKCDARALVSDNTMTVNITLIY